MRQTDNNCKACEGTGMLSDDEGWQYTCSICDGDGNYQLTVEPKLMDMDENNRLLD